MSTTLRTLGYTGARSLFLTVIPGYSPLFQLFYTFLPVPNLDTGPM